jgi:LysM repeat protein
MEIMKHELKQLPAAPDKFALTVYLSAQDIEFANELGTQSQTQKSFLMIAKKIVKEHYPTIRISVVNVMVGGFLITSMPFQTTTASAQSNTSEQTIQANSVFYQVKSGDTLWTLSRAFNITVDSIKRANQLATDSLQLNQRLIIPKAFHTIQTGDYLSVLARDYNTTTAAIRVANGLTSDSVRLGQTLIIPILISGAQTKPAEQPVAPASNQTYTVTAGDSLSAIARDHGTTTEAIRNANQLSSDVIRVGQVLIIPTTTSSAPEPTFKIQPIDEVYTVVAGDSLSVIAARFGTTVDALKTANGLTSNTLQIGQRLVIPNAKNTSLSPFSTYTVVAGDSLSVIAARFGVSVNDLRSANNLSSDILQIGQTLTIPNGSTAQPSFPPSQPSSYTVVAGDSLSVIAARFGVSVNDLRSANNLSSDVLRIGQVLNIPNGSPAPSPAPASEVRTIFTYTVAFGDSLSVIANRYKVSVDSIRTANNLRSDTLQVGQRLIIPDALNAPAQTGTNSLTYTTHTVKSGDTIWDLSVQYGIPQSELLKANNLTTSSRLSVGQQLSIPVHSIAVKPVVSQRHGELLDWWTEAQYVFTIGKTAKVTDLETGQSFNIKRAIGANHADCETVTVNDTNIARSIWGGFSWTPRAVILEVDGKRLAASMSFMPHDVQYIHDNGITGHFDVYFSNSTRHLDRRPDAAHQAQVERAAGVR